MGFGYGQSQSNSSMITRDTPPWLGKPPWLARLWWKPTWRSTSWIPNAKEVDRKAPLLGKSAPGSPDRGNIPKPQSTDFSSAFAFEVRSLEQPVSQSALGDKIPYVSCILFSAGGILRCSRFSPSYGEFFELSEVMGVPLKSSIFVWRIVHEPIQQLWADFPGLPIEAKGARASGAIHGRGRAMAMWPCHGCHGCHGCHARVDRCRPGVGRQVCGARCSKNS